VPAGKQIGNVTPDATRETGNAKKCVREFQGSVEELKSSANQLSRQSDKKNVAKRNVGVNNPFD
jgi:hypothetical protein